MGLAIRRRGETPYERCFLPTNSAEEPVKKTDAETQVLFEFIAHRYESGSLIITANQPFSAWDTIFPDSMMPVAAVDRLIHHATIIELEGESYRKKQQLTQAKS